ncbi:type I restriction-modification system specificity subunit [Clostridium perfringens]|uniref:Type I restriction-modification system specificity subunit n=1 Tax=Clostridium perfringens TaxID=1502 RepID=A0A2X2YKK3_CLOPF|nr:restriction endonuclease subunit S [Clostridium perfringens]SQB61075.1 type I restriction-modification system specificity subunit [Clostridium perfringens]
MILKKVKVKDLGKVITGTTPPTKIKEYYADEYNFIKPSYIEKNVRFFNESEEKLSELAKEKYINTFVPELSTCVVTIGSIGEKICLTKELCLTNQQINTVIPNEKYDNMFVYYLLKYNLFKVKAANAGSSSGRENVNKSTFENIEVEVPNLQIQKKIAKILSAYDDLIENNLKRIKLLEESAELLYKEWFVNLRFIGYENNKIIDGAPESWEKCKLGDFITFVKGRKPNNTIDNQNDDTVPYLLVEVIEGNNLIYTDDKKVPVAFENEILMIMDGSRSGTIYKSLYGAVGSTMSIIRINNKKINEEYLYYYLKMNEEHIKKNNTGAAIPHANKEFINSMDILLPEEKILQKYYEIANNISRQIAILKKNNQTLKEARDILIPKLIMGEIEV